TRFSKRLKSQEFHMIDIACPYCGRFYHTQESHLGKQIKCSNPRCNKEIVLMKAPPSDAPTERPGPSNFNLGRLIPEAFFRRKLMTKRTPVAIRTTAIIFLIVLCAFLLNRPGD